MNHAFASANRFNRLKIIATLITTVKLSISF